MLDRYLGEKPVKVRSRVSAVTRDELDCRLRPIFSNDIKKTSNDYLLVLFVFCKYLPISCLHSMV